MFSCSYQILITSSPKRLPVLSTAHSNHLRLIESLLRVRRGILNM